MSSGGSDDYRRPNQAKTNNNKDRNNSQAKRVRFDLESTRHSIGQARARCYGATQPLVPISRVDRPPREETPQAFSFGEYKRHKMEQESRTRKMMQSRNSHQTAGSSRPQKNSNNQSNHKPYAQKKIAETATRNSSSSRAKPSIRSGNTQKARVPSLPAPSQMIDEPSVVVATKDEQSRGQIHSQKSDSVALDVPSTSITTQDHFDAGSSNTIKSQKASSSLKRPGDSLSKPLYTAYVVKVEKPDDDDTNVENAASNPPMNSEPANPFVAPITIKIEQRNEEPVDLFEIKHEPIETSDYQIQESSYSTETPAQSQIPSALVPQTSYTELPNDDDIFNIFDDPTLHTIIGSFEVLDPDDQGELKNVQRQSEETQQDTVVSDEQLESAMSKFRFSA